MKTIKAKVVLLRAENKKYQVKKGNLFINDSRNRDWGSLEALVCERVTKDGYAWNGHGIQTDINHLYLTSDGNIEVGNYVISKFYGLGKVISNQWVDNRGKTPMLVQFEDIAIMYGKDGSYKDDGNKIYLNDCYKIVASSDESLNLPQIPQSFIKQYVESRGSIDEVEIEYTDWCDYDDDNTWGGLDKADLRIKVDSNNCVIVHTVKDSWSREEAEDDASNYDYLRGFIDGYGGEEPHGIMPDGFNNINEVWDRMYELKGNEEKLYTRKDVENFGLWLGQLPKKQKSKMIDLLFDDWINL